MCKRHIDSNSPVLLWLRSFDLESAWSGIFSVTREEAKFQPSKAWLHASLRVLPKPVSLASDCLIDSVAQALTEEGSEGRHLEALGNADWMTRYYLSIEAANQRRGRLRSANRLNLSSKPGAPGSPFFWANLALALGPSRPQVSVQTKDANLGHQAPG